jgi:hypothetical protein
MIMEIINQLSSQTGDKTEKANKTVAEKCIANLKTIPLVNFFLINIILIQIQRSI